MHNYELFCILSNKYTESELPELQNRIALIVDKCGGVINDPKDIWVQKQLAYKINKSKIGNFLLFNIESDPKNIAAINRALLLTSEILRHKLTKKVIKSSDKLAKEKALREKILLKQTSILSKELVGPKGLRRTEPQLIDDQVGNISTEELDKKIDEILAEKLV